MTSTTPRDVLAATASEPTPTDPRTGRRLSDAAFAVLLLLPGLALLVGIVLYPLIASLVTAFFKQSLVVPGRTFVGLENVVSVLQDEAGPLLAHTLIFAIGSTIGPFLIGFGLALALNTGIRGQRVLRGALLIPWLIPGVVVSFLWAWIFNANYGVANAILESLHVIDSPYPWLSSPAWAMAALVVAKSWASFPWIMVMLLAALQTVPGELHEAAEMDGAGPVRRFSTVTLPHLRPMIGIVLLLEFIWNFQHFDIIYVLTGGGPAGATSTFATAVYETAFKGLNLGRASAIGLVWMVLLLLLVVVYVRMSDRETR
jgi:multiple sugar transport system permease protein